MIITIDLEMPGGKAMDCLGFGIVIVGLFCLCMPYPYMVYNWVKYGLFKRPRPRGVIDTTR